MTVYKIDPLCDPRWEEFLKAHADASVFHTAGWLKSLQSSYGYEPFVLTTTRPGSPLTNGLVFCRIKSWLTGERLVSVPFADHCQPLFETVDEFHTALDWAAQGMGKRSRKPVEIRPMLSDHLGLEDTGFQAKESYRLHLLDLKPSLDDLLRSFDKNSVQRRLRRVTREDLLYEEGCSAELLEKFYYLQVLTRRKHQIPPQPRVWFRNLMNFLADRVTIRVVSKDATPIASILTLAYKGTVVYKYGCSDAAYNNLAGTPFLFWETIQDAKKTHSHTFDMGRSDLDNAGLIKFKSHWGTKDLALTYWRCPQATDRRIATSRGSRISGYIMSRLPTSMLVLLGRTLYKHIG